jgi:hypothetical protein
MGIVASRDGGAQYLRDSETLRQVFCNFTRARFYEDKWSRESHYVEVIPQIFIDTFEMMIAHGAEPRTLDRETVLAHFGMDSPRMFRRSFQDLVRLGFQVRESDFTLIENEPKGLRKHVDKVTAMSLNQHHIVERSDLR